MLIISCSADINERIENVVRSNMDMIYRVAYHCLKNKADAEDVAHNVFIKWWENAPVFTDDTHQKAWFIRVTINTCKDLNRSAWLRKSADLENCRDMLYISPFSLLDEIRTLSPDYSTVIYLHYYEGYSVREIAEILHKNERAIQSRLYRARQQLKKRLEE